MKIYQLLHTLSYGDAISTEVLSLDKVLKDSGFETGIFSINTHQHLKGKSINYKQMDKDFEGVLILHYSLGSPINELYLNLPNVKKVLIYHNITPKKWFENVNFRVANDIEVGIKELPRLLEKTDLIISDSDYNAKELKEIGYDSIVLNLPFDSNKWNEVPEGPGFKALINPNELNLLHVGRLAPNKCIEDIIKVFYFLKHKVQAHSKLWLVGIDSDTEIYSFGLKRMVEDLSLRDSVVFTGCLLDDDIKALYKNCSSYICMSEHEGFCLPVVEAMNYELPVISFASTALTDTVGDGGVLFTEKKHPQIAELVNEVYQNKELNSRLKHAGLKRVSELSIEKFQKEALDIFNNLINA